jgi:hypothetical protein
MHATFGSGSDWDEHGTDFLRWSYLERHSRAALVSGEAVVGLSFAAHRRKFLHQLGARAHPMLDKRVPSSRQLGVFYKRLGVRPSSPKPACFEVTPKLLHPGTLAPVSDCDGTTSHNERAQPRARPDELHL